MPAPAGGTPVPEIDERLLFGVLASGGVIAALGWLWLLVRAAGTGWGWLVGIVVLPPVSAWFLVRRPDRAAAPVGAVLLGLMLAAAAVGANRLAVPSREAQTITVNGEQVGTLTGATATALDAFLTANRTSAVLQMANRQDVSDDTLKRLAEFPDMRELDLNDTPITDAGLANLAACPKLENLRIARTKATPDGVSKHVLGNPRLKRLDVTGLGVPGKVLREWKAAGPDRQFVN
jgi:hypothetical protein